MVEPDFEKMSPEEISEYQKQNCIFCKIIKGDIPSRKPYEDDKISAVMDINPAAKGHLLIMTKEHYPVLPIIPPDLSAHMFRTTRELGVALKKAMMVDRLTIFIANGGVAGQQSPHFLYHMIPRENMDGLDNFNIPSVEVKEEDVAQLMPVLKGKLGLMMKGYYAKFNPTVNKKPTEGTPMPSATSASAMTAALTGRDMPRPQTSSDSPAQRPGAPHADPNAPAPMNQQELAKFIFDNPTIKEKIMKEPEVFKRELEADPMLKVMFTGINIVKLSEALRKMGALMKE